MMSNHANGTGRTPAGTFLSLSNTTVLSIVRGLIANNIQLHIQLHKVYFNKKAFFSYNMFEIHKKLY